MHQFFMFEIFKMPHFSYLILKMGKWCISNISNIDKWGISNSTRSIFKEHRKRKSNSSILGNSNNYANAITWQIIFHMLYGAFHITFRIRDKVWNRIEPCAWRIKKVCLNFRISKRTATYRNVLWGTKISLFSRLDISNNRISNKINLLDY